MIDPGHLRKCVETQNKHLRIICITLIILIIIISGTVYYKNQQIKNFKQIKKAILHNQLVSTESI